MVIALAVAVLAAVDMSAVFARDLMMFQQNSYRGDRYVRWFEQSGESTSLGRIFCCVALMFMLVNHLPFFAGAAVAVRSRLSGLPAPGGSTALCGGSRPLSPRCSASLSD